MTLHATPCECTVCRVVGMIKHGQVGKTKRSQSEDSHTSEYRFRFSCHLPASSRQQKQVLRPTFINFHFDAYTFIL